MREGVPEKPRSKHHRELCRIWSGVLLKLHVTVEVLELSDVPNDPRSADAAASVREVINRDCVDAKAIPVSAV